ncbi:MAG TPA: hypothetical protein DIT64_21700, partial [Verrucomicrobiales bacterium]|nr:hypothetical protein [Verrucomicrobiales bacterium]
MSHDEQSTIPTSPLDGSRPALTGVWQAPGVEQMRAMLPQYEVLEMIGRGGMGAVYKGRQKSLNRLVAIKILPPGAADDEFKFTERFQNEARTMAAMNHPAIVGVYDFGETADGLLYFIMEFVDGTDVQRMIQTSGRLSGEQALRITADVCDALAYAHKRGVIHRDIKPANILIDTEGRVKVADFGLAKMQDASRTSALTRSNVAMGTPDYVAPEVLSPGMTADHRADLYAVGVMLYQMLTGEVPRGMFKLPSERTPGADPRFDEVICKAMEQDREERYQTASDVRQALESIRTTPLAKDQNSGARAQRSRAMPKAPSASVSLGSFKWRAAAVGVVALGAAAFFVLKGGKEPPAKAQPPSSAQADATAPVAAPDRTIDWINSPPATVNGWSPEWNLKDGVLTPSAQLRWQFGLMKNGLVRLHVRLAPDYTEMDGNGPQLQLTIRSGSLNGPQGRTGHMQFQTYVPNRTASLHFQDKTSPGLPVEQVVEGKPLQVSELGWREVQWEFRVVGDEYSAWADGKKIASVRDARIASGYCMLEVRPGIQITLLETEGIEPVKATVPAPAVKETWTDQLAAREWSSAWIFEGGVLRTTDKNPTAYLGRMTDGALRIGFQPEPEKLLPGNNPPLQISLRSTYYDEEAKVRGTYQIQIYPDRRISHLLYLAKGPPGQNDPPPEYLWKDRPWPDAGAVADLEIRAEGGNLALLQDGKTIASAQDSRLSAGSCVMMASPGVRILKLETLGVAKETEAAPALSKITRWRDVTEAVRARARAIPELVVEEDRVRHVGSGKTVDISLMEEGSGDRAVWLRYVGDAQVSLWFKGSRSSAFVLAQRTQTLFKRAEKGATASTDLRAAVPHPAAYDALKPHELLVAVQGDTVRAWLDGRFVGEARDPDIPGSSTALVFTKFGDVRRVEVGEVEPSSENWTDWLGPKLAAGGFAGGQWKREAGGISTDQVLAGFDVLPKDTRDGAVKVTFVMRGSEGVLLDCRETKESGGRHLYNAQYTGKNLYI